MRADMSDPEIKGDRRRVKRELVLWKNTTDKPLARPAEDKEKAQTN